MQEAEHLIRVSHVTDPRVPSSVRNAVSEARNNKRNHQDWVRWMDSNDYVGQQMAPRGDEGNAPLACLKVDDIVQEGCCCISHER